MLFLVLSSALSKLCYEEAATTEAKHARLTAMKKKMNCSNVHRGYLSFIVMILKFSTANSVGICDKQPNSLILLNLFDVQTFAIHAYARIYIYICILVVVGD